MPFASIRDIRMYYERGGHAESGRRLLLVNGSGRDLRQKPSILDGPLAADFELLAFDQRGLGQTEKPDRAYSMADYAADALALLDPVGWKRFRVYGVSFGGMVAQELAVGDGDPDRDLGFRRQPEARRGHDTYDRLGRLTLPVLIAAGRYDGIAAPANQEAMQRAIAGSRLEWFEGGHVFMLQDPRAHPVIRDFLL